MYIYVNTSIYICVCVRKGERPGRGPTGRGDDRQEYGEEHQPEPRPRDHQTAQGENLYSIYDVGP